MKSSGLSSSPFFFFFLISKALNAYRLIKASTRPQLFIFFFFFFWPSHLSGCEVEDELREERLRKLWQERFVWALHASEVLNGDVSTHHFCWWRRETARAGDAILIPKGYKRQKTLIAGNCRQKSITVIEKRWKFQQLSRKKKKSPFFICLLHVGHEMSKCLLDWYISMDFRGHFLTFTRRLRVERWQEMWRQEGGKWWHGFFSRF